MFSALIVACGSSKTEVQKDDPAPTVTGGCASGVSSANIKIFNENPFVGSGDPNLSYSAVLLSGYTTSAVLSGLDQSCLIRSDHYKVVSDTLYPSQVGTVTSSSQIYAPTSPQFQQFNAFYYANQTKSLLTGLGADLSSLGMVSIDAHCNQSNNAYFSPYSKELCFGYHSMGGGKYVWAADDSDVIMHETGHSMNHTLASTDILNSSGEAGAIDEAVADYWALTKNGNPKLAEWFLGSIGAAYIRDASLNLSYPASMVYEIHDDSRVLAEVLWDLRSAGNLGANTTDALVKRALQLLPATARYKNFYNAFYTAAGPGFLNLSAAQKSLIATKFQNKGLGRSDDATGLRLSTTHTQVYVIDDHTYSVQSGGNCNGQLDVGETALVLVNLENPNGADMGMGVVASGAAPAGTTIPAGGNVGEFFRLNANSDFKTSLPAGSTRKDATAMAAFLISASTAGVKNFSLSFTPMYADPTGAMVQHPDVTLNFSLTVGSAATSTGCTNGALWP